MASGVGAWWSNTWWGKRSDAISVTLTIVILAFSFWKAFFP
jgi:hypothetical protein